MAWYRCGGTPSNILALPTPSEASGAIAKFNTDLTENLLHAVAEFEASQASGTPTPSAPIPIVGVDKVNITRTGKNLFNPNTTENEWVTVQNVITTSPGSKSMRMKCTSGDSITISCINATSGTNILLIGTLNANGEVTSRSVKANGDTSLIKTASTNDKYFLIAFYNYANTGGGQLELGSTATAYEAYNGVTALINLGDTYYGGEVDAVTGKITVKQKAFDLGDYTYAYNGVRKWFTVSNFAQDNNLPIPSSASEATEAISDIYVADNQNNISANADLTGVFGIFASGALVIKNTDYTNASDFQNAMRGKKIVCSITTPATAQASNTAEIPTLNGFNQVYADSGDVDVTYFETVGHKI